MPIGLYFVWLTDCRHSVILFRYPARSTQIEPPFSLEAKPYFKRVGVFGTVFFSIMGVASVFVAATNADGSFKQPMLAAILFGVFWGAFILLGIYLWIFSKKYKLVITQDAIEQSGVFTQRRIAIHKIQDAKWRNWPQGGSIKLKTADSQMSIELGISSSREYLIRYLHSVIPANSQLGWDAFSRNNEKSTTKSSLSPFWLGVMFYVFGASFVIAWIMGQGAVNLVAAVLNCGFATYLITRKSQDNIFMAL